MNKSIIYIFLLLCISSYSQSEKIEKIIFEGNKRTKSNYLKKIIEIKENNAYDSLKIENVVYKLKRLPSIADATYNFNKETKELTFKVKENFTTIPMINFWTVEDEVWYLLGFSEYNFLGKNYQVGSFYQFNGNENHSFGFGFKAPYLFSNKIGFSSVFKNWKSDEPLYFNEQSAIYNYQNVSFENLAMLHINTKNQLQFGATFFKENYNYLSGFNSETIPQELEQNKLLLKTVHQFDGLTYNYQYLDGLYNEAYLQYVFADNQEDFLIFWNDIKYFKRIGLKGNFANRLRFGLATNTVSPFAPFTLDNHINIRGVGDRIDRGTGTLVYNTEYRHTLLEKKWFVLQSNVFTDVGSWRLPGGKFSDFTDSNNIRAYSGFGFRLMHKSIYNAIFRVDYSFGITKNEQQGLVIGLGQYF